MKRTGYMTPKVVAINENGGSITDAEQLLINDDSTCILSCHNTVESPWILFDFDIKTTGYFFIETECSTHDTIKISYGPVKEMLTSVRYVKMPNDGVFFVDEEYIACRYMKVEMLSESGLPLDMSMKIRKIGLKFSAYPAVYMGGFESEDEVLNKIWEIGAYTAQICMQKNIFSSTYQPLPDKHTDFIKNWTNKYSPYVMFDGPRRDREVWVGDLRTEGLVAYSAFGAYDVLKSSLVLFHDLQYTDGIVPGCGSTWQSFREYNLWYIVSIWENYLFSGDREFLDYMYPSYRSFMDWLMYNLSEDGFLYNEATWMWTFPREGYGSATQCILVYMLECAANIEKVYENSSDVALYTEAAKKAKDSINRMYWDDEKGAYFDLIKIKGNEQVVLSDLNGYAVAFGIADEKRSARVLDYMKRTMWNEYGSTTIDVKVEGPELTEDAHLGIAAVVKNMPNPSKTLEKLMWAHNKQIWPFIVAYEVEARFVAGDVDNAFELIRRCWGNMIDQEPGTFWEMVNAEDGSFDIRPFQEYSKTDSMNSAAHGWSGWVSYIMQAYILGVKPASPGFRKVTVTPCPGPLKKYSGSVATPLGAIDVTVDLEEDGVARVDIIKPAAVDSVVELTNERFAGREHVINTKDK